MDLLTCLLGRRPGLYGGLGKTRSQAWRVWQVSVTRRNATVRVWNAGERTRVPGMHISASLQRALARKKGIHGSLTDESVGRRRGMEQNRPVHLWTLAAAPDRYSETLPQASGLTRSMADNSWLEKKTRKAGASASSARRCAGAEGVAAQRAYGASRCLLTAAARKASGWASTVAGSQNRRIAGSQDGPRRARSRAGQDGQDAGAQERRTQERRTVPGPVPCNALGVRRAPQRSRCTARGARAIGRDRNPARARYASGASEASMFGCGIGQQTRLAACLAAYSIGP